VNHRTPLRLLAVLLSLVLVAGLCVAQTESQPPTQNRIRILGISIVGNQSTDAGLIRAHSGLSVGQDVTGDDIQTAIEQLWKLNLFSDVEIVEERETPEGVYISIHVKELPRLERIDIKGNRKLKGDDLDKLVKLTSGQVVEPRDLVLLQNRLKKKYEEMGYLLAEIDVKTFASTVSGKEIVDVNVKEGPKVKIRKIAFEGNHAFSNRTLRGKLKDFHQKGLFRSGEFKREKLDDDKQMLVDFYRSKGYRDFEVVSDTAMYSADRRWITLNFEVSEGPIYHYGTFTWAGNKLFDDAALNAKMRVASGDLYNAQKLQQSLADIGSGYYEKGYIYAAVTPNEKVVNDHIVDVTLDVSEGNEFKVNRIFVEGNTKTKERVIRRELVLFPGETFDVTKLQRSIREVNILNYFSSVNPDVVPISDNQVDLYLKVEEKSTDQANVSAGYSQTDGFIGAVGFQMNNLMGNGQQLSLDWNFGQIYRSFSLSFTEPWFRNHRTLVGASFSDTHRGGSVYGFDEDIIGGTVRVGQRLKWPDDYFRVDYVYGLSRTVYSNFTEGFATTDPRGLEENVPRISSSLTQIITRDSRNDPEFPSKGSVSVLRTELTGGPLGGNDQYIKGEFDNQWYVPITGQLVLAANTETGALDGLTRNVHDIPYFDYFFMGGAGLSLGTALRGYDELKVGPQAVSPSTGEVFAVGGKTLFKQSFELRYPIVRNPTIFVLGFAEAGNVWTSLSQTDLTDVRRSVGLGVRLFMPMIGMIGLDYGLGLDYYDARGIRYTRWVPHFQFGRGF
jgi:outer membrane protein insertion porin family